MLDGSASSNACSAALWVVDSRTWEEAVEAEGFARVAGAIAGEGDEEGDEEREEEGEGEGAEAGVRVEAARRVR